MCPDWIQMREMKCRWFLFGYNSKEAHAAWLSLVSYLLVSSNSSAVPTCSRLQASPTFPLTTAPPRWIAKETRQLCLSGFQGLILSKTFASHSNSVLGVSSSLQMKMQIQPAYIFPNSMYTAFPICWHRLLGSACAVRNSRHRDLVGNQQRSRELSLLLLLLFWLLSQHWKVKRKQRKRKERWKKHRHWHSKNRVPSCSPRY